MAVALPLLMLTGCATIGGVKPAAVSLPPAPPCMGPVAVPEIEAGMDARVALARQRAALKAANGHLICSKDWYDGIRKEYAKQ